MIDTFSVLLVLVGTVYPSNPEQGEHSICFEKKVTKMRWNYLYLCLYKICVTTRW